MENFELGPLQAKWIQSLRDHPERQMKYSLGERDLDGTYRACCLGEAGLIAGVCYWSEAGTLSTMDGEIAISHQVVLDNDSYKAIGLKSESGHTKNLSAMKIIPHEITQTSLSYYNDHGKTWPQIADIIMADPSQYFTEPK